MLQIQDVCKEYRTSGYTQKALDHISLSLRDNEFVAILGPSGSGKTTLLNIVGGLDRYDSGDLVINGTSTKEYKDRDWDAYRNHSVGFIFQSYNLIPHQTVLANVELALTIAGVSKKERTRRAKEALERVGLKDHINKRPNQLSGGQMQRVAIARALINEPTVLLADEPTGALDSETSIQVMELLKEVAKDRLVVMVTHNPELAKTYANRIVELHDGKITSDSNPFTPKETSATDKRRLGKASMSFFTALGLSFMNLKTKLRRTLLVAFAGSIGIIGIALILALSTGTNSYIDNIQRETLSEYPISLQKRSINLSSMLSERQEQSQPSSEDQVVENQLIKKMFSTTETNDLGAFKEYLESHQEEIGELARSIEYQYNISPLIFIEQDERAIQVHPDTTFSFLGLSSSLLSAYSGLADTFQPMPKEPSLYEDQYEVKAGRWPKEYNETVLVLNSAGRTSDMTLYAIGMKDHKVLEQMIASFLEGEKIEEDAKPESYAYEEFIGISFRLVNKADLFTYDEDYDIWTDRSGDGEFLKDLVKNGEQLKIVGVVMPKEGATVTMLNSGVNYLPSLIEHVISEAANSAPVLAQKSDPSINLLTGRPFAEGEGTALSRLTSIFSIDPKAIQDAFQFDENAFQFDFSEFDGEDFDLSDFIDPKELSFTLPELSVNDVIALLNSVKINVTLDEMKELLSSALTAYYAYASQNPLTDYARLPEAIKAYCASGEAKELILEDLKGIFGENGASVISTERIEELINDVITNFSKYLVDMGAPALEELLEKYRAGEAELLDVVRYLSEFIPVYFQTEEARLMLEGELDKIRSELLSGMTISTEQVSHLLDDLQTGYETYARANELPVPSMLIESFSRFLLTKEGRKLISSGILNMIDISDLENQIARITEEYSDQIKDQLSPVMENIISQIMTQMSGMMTDAMSSFAEQLSSAISLNGDALANAITINMEDKELRSLISSLMSGESATYESNLARFGYAEVSKPDEIVIYPKSFEAKSELFSQIDTYNEKMLDAGQENKVIHYTDLVGTMMNSVTNIVNAISYILIAFVSVSLVVSSIMIGVITYISVLERRKEIGILRAIGASKRNVASVFNAETFIIGTLAGILGVLLAALILIPINILIHHLSGQPDLNGVIPIRDALLLVLLSILLTLIGGLIPSKSAAKSDPVTALRTE